MSELHPDDESRVDAEAAEDQVRDDEVTTDEKDDAATESTDADKTEADAPSSFDAVISGDPVEKVEAPPSPRWARVLRSPSAASPSVASPSGVSPSLPASAAAPPTPAPTSASPSAVSPSVAVPDSTFVAAKPIVEPVPTVVPPVAGPTPVATTATAAPLRPAKPPKPARPPATKAPAAGAVRKVELTLSRVDPLSVMKMSFLLSVAVGVMIVVATAVLWSVVDNLGIFAAIEDFYQTVMEGSSQRDDILQYVAFNRVISLATLIAVVDVFILTALATIFAFLYNVVAALVGGIHLTLTDD